MHFFLDQVLPLGLSLAAFVVSLIVLWRAPSDAAVRRLDMHLASLVRDVSYLETSETAVSHNVAATSRAADAASRHAESVGLKLNALAKELGYEFEAYKSPKASLAGGSWRSTKEDF